MEAHGEIGENFWFKEEQTTLESNQRQQHMIMSFAMEAIAEEKSRFLNQN